MTTDLPHLRIMLFVFLSLNFVPHLLALTIAPSQVTLVEGATLRFSSSLPSVWTADCGTISSTGLFQAPLDARVCILTATANDGSGKTSTHANVVSPITIMPVAAKTVQGSTQQFTASVPVRWIASCGIISASGLFKATGVVGGVCTIKGVATSGIAYTAYGQDAILPSTTFVITPAMATLREGARQQFAASGPATWTASCGTVVSSGMYTAPSSAQSCTVTAKATDGSGRTASMVAAVTSISISTFRITPTNLSLKPGATQQFAASGPALWTASCGAIASRGLYTAPLATGSCTITAKAVDGSGHTAATLITIAMSNPLTITPSAARLHAIATQQFTANESASWTASCGTINSATGIFTAPATAGSCIVTASATGKIAAVAQSMVTVDVVNYVSWKGDTSNLGLQSHETSLTPSNLNSAHFAVRWTAGLNGTLYAQPLYMNGLMINGVPHNVVFAATTNDSLYALDGDTGALLWQTSFLSNGVTAVKGSSINSPMPQIGILGTPAIDAGTGTLYLVAETSERNATYFPHRLHAIDITNGREKFGGPALITEMNPALSHTLQRPGLVVANRMVYIGFGSISDSQPNHGFLVAFDKETLLQKYVWNTTPTGTGGGIWMSGGAPAVDAAGNLYVATANGSLNGPVNLGEAAIKLSPSLQVIDYFAPSNYAALNAGDVDLGSGSIALLPDQPGKFLHELILCGKPPSIYVLDRDILGHVSVGGDDIIQRLPFGMGHTDTCYATPAFWNSNLYIAGGHQALKMYKLDPGTGLLSSGALLQGSYTYGWQGAQPVVSADGNSNGIVWTLDPGTGQLFANEAANLARELYSVSVPGGMNPYTVPTVVNGHVYVGAHHELIAYAVQ